MGKEGSRVQTVGKGMVVVYGRGAVEVSGGKEGVKV